MRENSNNIKGFVIGTIIAGLATVAGSILSPIEVRFLYTLTSSSVLVGVTFAIGSLFLAILSLWLGRLSDKYGRERYILFGVILGILYPLMYASVSNIFQYMGIRLFWAFSAVAVGPVFIAYLQDILKDSSKKGQFFGYFYSALSISGSVGAFIGGLLSDLAGFKACYFAVSAIFVLIFLISFTQFSFKKTLTKIRPRKKLFFSLSYIFSKPKLAFYYLQDISWGLNWGAKPIIWPLIIFQMSGSDAATGSIFATMGIVAFFVLPIIGKFVDKVGDLKSLALSIVIQGIFGALLVFSSNLYLFWVLAALYAFGEAMQGPASGTVLTDNIDSEYRGEVLGFNSIFSNLLSTISTFMAGLLLAVFAPRHVLLIYISLFWLIQPVLYIYYKNKIRVM